MDTQTYYIGISLLSLVIINIILGSISSIFTKQFDKVKFIQGIIKGLIIVGCFIGVIYVGKLTPNIIVINIDGKDVNLGVATYLIMLSGYLYYGKEVLIKLGSFIKGDYKIMDIVPIEQTQIIQEEVKPEENKPTQQITDK